MNNIIYNILFTLILGPIMVYSQQTIIPDINGNIQEYELGELSSFPPLDGVSMDFNYTSNFPLEINGDNTCKTSPKGGLVYANLDLDLKNEIVYHSCNEVHITKPNNAPLPGWPIILPKGESVEWSPSLGDINGDGKKNIVFSSYNDTVSKLYAYNINGTIVSGFPIALGKVNFIQALNDVTGNNINEIVITENDTDSSSKVHVFKGDGSTLTGFPFTNNQVVATHVSVGDINNNGNANIIYATTNKVYALDQLGNTLSGFPVQLTHTNELFSYSSPILVDIDHDFFHEIIIGSHDKTSGYLNVFNHLGTQKSGWPQQTANWIYASALPLDINNDNDYEITIGDFNQSDLPMSSLYVFDKDGNRIDSAGGLFGITAISAMDIDNDNFPELFVNGNSENNLESHYYGFDDDLQQIDQWNLTSIGNTIFSPLVFGDMENTSTTNALTMSKEESAQNIFINLLESSLFYDELNNPNPFFQVNEKHNGYIPNQFTTDISLEKDEEDNIKIYPNPTNGAFTIESNTTIDFISFYDYNGKLLLEQTASSRRAKLSITHVSNGAYVLKIKTGNQYFYRQVIKH